MENLLCKQIKNKNENCIPDKLNNIIALNDNEENNKKEYTRLDLIHFLAIELLAQNEKANVSVLNKYLKHHVEMYDCLFKKL